MLSIGNVCLKLYCYPKVTEKPKFLDVRGKCPCCLRINIMFHGIKGFQFEEETHCQKGPFFGLQRW